MEHEEQVGLPVQRPLQPKAEPRKPEALHPLGRWCVTVRSHIALSDAHGEQLHRQVEEDLKVYLKKLYFDYYPQFEFDLED